MTPVAPVGRPSSGSRTPPRRPSSADRGSGRNLRINVMRILIVSLFVTLSLRLWSLQVLQSGDYKSAAEDNRVREAVTPAPRGMIVDDMGRVLVSNRTSLVVSVDHSVLDRLPDGGRGVITSLSAVLGKQPIELVGKIRLCSATVPVPCWNGSPYQPIPVATDVPAQQALRIIEHPEEFPGVTADTQAIRTYPDGTLAGHELGYVGPISQDQLKREPNRLPTDVVGLGGLEQQYDNDLRGTNGIRKVAVDRFGRVSGDVSSTDPVVGNSLVLGLDSQVQQALEDSLRTAVGRSAGQTASGVVLDVTTGQVVAMASLPSFNPSVFVGGISQADYAALNDPASGTPLISRAYQGSSAPGSTFKPISLVAAVTQGGNPLDGSYDCAPNLQVGNQTFHNFEGSSAGAISLHQAIVISCDVIFDKFAYDAWLADGGLRNGPGPYPPAKEYFVNNARTFGYGARTGVDLPGETTGAVVDRAQAKANWDQLKDSYCRRAKTGYPEESDPAQAAQFQRYASEACQDGYLYNGGAATQFAIGQGAYLDVSPLQMAVAYAAIANGGTVYQPHVAKAILKPDGSLLRTIKPTVVRKLNVDPAVLDYVRQAMGDVTTSGTAAGAFGGFPMQQVHVAGKTGTAQVEGKGDTSWFCSIGPLDNPKYAVVMTVPESGQGALVAAPAARRVWEALYGIGRPAALPSGQEPVKLPTLRSDGTVAPPREP